MRRSLCSAIFLRLTWWPILAAVAWAQPALPSNSWRILSLSTAATHILLTLGHPPAAIDSYGQVADPGRQLPVIGKGTILSQEKLTELQINCVLHWSYQTEIAQWCQKHRLRAESIEPLRLQQIPQLIERLGEMVAAQEKARQLRENFQRQLAAVASKAAAGRSRVMPVYFELYSAGKLAGEETYVGDLVRAAGGRCLTRKSGLVSVETVLEAAPEVIFFVEGFADAESISNRPGLQATPAVRNGRMVPVERRLLVEGLAPVEAINFLQQHLR